MRGISVFAGIAVLAIPATSAEADVTISNDTTSNMTCSGGVCAPTATDANLNTSDLESLLASGAVTVTTTGSGVQAGNIVVADAVTWTSANALTLDAYQSITVNSIMSVDGAAGLNLVTNAGGKDGMLTFGRKGHAVFSNLSSVLAINGLKYTLAGDIKTLASDIAARQGGNFALAADYNASKDGTYSTSPIDTSFSGNFEGLGNTIRNLSISDSNAENVGLFANVDLGRIANIGLVNANVAATADDNGAGYGVGALVGRANGTVFGSYSSGMVAGMANDIGGLIGALGTAGSADHSHSSASVSTDGDSAYVGGLIGFNEGMIIDSYATGVVSATGEYNTLGGLTGYNVQLIEMSFASASINGGTGAGICGGLVGSNYQYSLVENAYATGNPACAVSGSAAGFAAENFGRIRQSYSTGQPNAADDGGFVGVEETGGGMQRDYWDTTTSGTDIGVYEGSSKGLSGLTTAQLQAGLPKYFSPKIWAENPAINGGLPYLIANPPPK